jgi:tetratricopeptide (TPR) repeat protein
METMATQRKTFYRSANACLLSCVLTLALGCQSLAGPLDVGGPGAVKPATAGEDIGADNPVVQVSGESDLTEKTKKASTRVKNFVTGREQEDPARAKQLYQQGDALFRQAQSQPREQAKETFAKSAKLFKRAGQASPGTALQQDAMFMQGESLFFADRLIEASDVYEKLQKEFPRNRHIDRVAARLFSISRYWIDTVKAGGNSWFIVNLTDPKRPRLDTDGHALRVLDQIRFDDPTGRLADDATMAAAAEYIRQQKFEEADEFLTDLRETFSDSEHLFLAHLLGIRCKLETYAGPAYSGLVLEEAETLVRQTRQRFPDKLADPKYGDMVARAAAEISYARAQRLTYRADYREKRKEYGAARYYYHQLLEAYPDTPHADTARERLAQIEKLPAVPQSRLSWLTTIFPDTERSKPLETTQPTTEKPETMLR